jgi:hypothetical protein
MILIYTNKVTARINYTCHFLFKEQLGIDYIITNDAEKIKMPGSFLLNYSHKHIPHADFCIHPHALLFENGISVQDTTCFDFDQHKAFFKTTDSDFPFDILAATFFLISRYEEYLPHVKDSFGRYAHENSIAFKNGFLQMPLVNIWTGSLKKAFLEKSPDMKFREPVFTTLLTYDIDMAWSYKHKGLFRNIGGFFNSPGIERWKVLLHLTKDPFDAYDFLDSLHDRMAVKPIYFFLVASSTGEFDKNISPQHPAMKKLIRNHASKYGTGLHPSWKSNQHPDEIINEKKNLEYAADQKITRSRQHYIKFSLPETFERLINAGIENEYSMGYGSINGFRASVASPFYWYNLSREEVTLLRIFPFCFMDANSHYEQKQSPDTSYQEIMHYYHTCKKVNGFFIPIFHNNFLGEGREFEGWKELYIKFTSQLPQ